MNQIRQRAFARLLTQLPHFLAVGLDSSSVQPQVPKAWIECGMIHPEVQSRSVTAQQPTRGPAGARRGCPRIKVGCGFLWLSDGAVQGGIGVRLGVAPKTRLRRAK